MDYILTEASFEWNLVYYIAPHQSYLVKVGPNTTFSMNSSVHCMYFLEIKPWVAPDFIEGPSGVSIRLVRKGADWVDSNYTKYCEITQYGIKILEGDPEKLIMDVSTGEINVVIQDQEFLF